MAKVKVIKNTDDYDPFTFQCTSCGKKKVYTQEEIDKTKKPHPKPETYMFDFFIPCPFCKKGFMEPPTFVSFHDLEEKWPKFPTKISCG